MRKISLIRAPSGFSFSSGNLSTHPEEEAEDRGSDRDDTRNNDNKKRTNVGENTDDDDNDDNDDESQDPSSSSAASSNNASTTHREGGAEENSSTDDDSNSNTMSKNNSSQCEYNQIREFASEETKRVQLWRMIVIGSILIAGALISTVSYLILRSPFHNDTTANDSVSNFQKHL